MPGISPPAVMLTGEQEKGRLRASSCEEGVRNVEHSARSHDAPAITENIAGALVSAKGSRDTNSDK